MISDEPLVPIVSSPRLVVEPIWEVPIDNVEGPLYQKYIETHPDYRAVYVRATVRDMLIQAVEKLPESFTLIVRAGHRPLEVQLQVLAGIKQRYANEHAQATEAEALAFARTYVSDPAIRIPPHCCGAAVDVDARDTQTKTLIDFGCSVNTDDDISFLDTNRITQEQRNNRDVLHGAMRFAGFAPFEHEWWHFSYGDQTWADTYGKQRLYDVIDK